MRMAAVLAFPNIYVPSIPLRNALIHVVPPSGFRLAAFLVRAFNGHTAIPKHSRRAATKWAWQWLFR